MDQEVNAVGNIRDLDFKVDLGIVDGLGDPAHVVYHVVSSAVPMVVCPLRDGNFGFGSIGARERIRVEFRIETDQPVMVMKDGNCGGEECRGWKGESMGQPSSCGEDFG